MEKKKQPSLGSYDPQLGFYQIVEYDISSAKSNINEWKCSNVTKRTYIFTYIIYAGNQLIRQTDIDIYIYNVYIHIYLNFFNGEENYIRYLKAKHGIMYSIFI